MKYDCTKTESPFREKMNVLSMRDPGDRKSLSAKVLFGLDQPPIAEANLFLDPKKKLMRGQKEKN